MPMGRMTVRRLAQTLYINNATSPGPSPPTAGWVETFPAAPTNGLLTIVQPTALTGGWGWNVPFSMQFSLNQLLNVTELTNIFDQYRILGVKVFISWNHNTSAASQASGLCGLQWYPDFDDSTPPTSDEVRERMGVISRRWSADKVTQVMSVRPRPIFTSGTAMVPYGTWFDCQTNPNTIHYGLKGLLTNVTLPARTSGDPAVTSFRFDVQYVVQFRSVT